MLMLTAFMMSNICKDVNSYLYKVGEPVKE
jgi:hypothetical protein